MVEYNIFSIIFSIILVEVFFIIFSKSNLKEEKYCQESWIIIKIASIVMSTLLTLCLFYLTKNFNYLSSSIIKFVIENKSNVIIGVIITLGIILFFVINRYLYKYLEKKNDKNNTK
jgi:uncharacterized protein YacL